MLVENKSMKNVTGVLTSFNNLNEDLLVLLMLLLLLLLLYPSIAFNLLSNIFFTPPELISGFFVVPDPTISVKDLQDKSDDDFRRLCKKQIKSQWKEIFMSDYTVYIWCRKDSLLTWKFLDFFKKNQCNRIF